MSRRFSPGVPPANVRRVLAEFPGITTLRARQIAKDREVLRERAARAARRRRHLPPVSGDLPMEDLGLLNSFAQAGEAGRHLLPDFLASFESDLPSTFANTFGGEVL